VYLSRMNFCINYKKDPVMNYGLFDRVDIADMWVKTGE